MRTHRFGRKIKLPATIAIKHQIRMRMAQFELEQAEIATSHEALLGQSSEELPVNARSRGASRGANHGRI